MEIVYFSRGRRDKKDPFLSAIKNVVPEKRVFTFSGIDEFKRRLEGKRSRKILAVIVARNEETLIDAYFAHYLLKGVPSILVLPDRERHTAALGYRIGPDHTFPIDAEISGFMSTVAKIIGENREDISLDGPPGFYGSLLSGRRSGYDEASALKPV